METTTKNKTQNGWFSKARKKYVKENIKSYAAFFSKDKNGECYKHDFSNPYNMTNNMSIVIDHGSIAIMDKIDKLSEIEKFLELRRICLEKGWLFTAKKYKGKKKR